MRPKFYLSRLTGNCRFLQVMATKCTDSESVKKKIFFYTPLKFFFRDGVYIFENKKKPSDPFTFFLA